LKKLGLVLTAAGMLVLSACGASNSNTAHDMNHMHMEESAAPMMLHVKFKTADANPVANKPTTLSIHVRDHEHPYIDKFDIVHTKKMHLIIVDESLQTFIHIHPDYQGKGNFTTTFDAPHAGKFVLFADFKPTGAAQHVERTELVVGGSPAAPAPTPLVDNTSDTVKINGKTVTLAIDSKKAGVETMLTYTLKDEKTGKAITNLQPYLGALGHVVIISQDTQTYIHVHPMEGGGSTPMFMTTFPKAGTYKVFAQFQHLGRIFTVPYVIQMQ
jgi:hypothetical protein